MDERTRRDFGEFVAAKSPGLLRLAYVLTGDQHAAEDLLQGARVPVTDLWRPDRNTAGWVSVKDEPGDHLPAAVDAELGKDRLEMVLHCMR